MPVTFLAHQAPVLPIARRWPDRADGVALVVGSMAPDMAYALAGTRFDVWAHAFPALALFCVPVTLVVSWLIVAVMSPVVWDHLPDVGTVHVRDFRGLVRHRFRWGWAALSAQVGALSHVAIDHFTHDWGWFAQHVDWYDAVVVHNVLGRDWTVFRIMQYSGHVVGTSVCVWLLARYGRQRWMAEAASQVRPFAVTRRSTTILVSALAIGLAAGGSWVARSPGHMATDVMRLSGPCFAALTLACFVLRPRVDDAA